jgi:hypothetical protein
MREPFDETFDIDTIFSDMSVYLSSKKNQVKQLFKRVFSKREMVNAIDKLINIMPSQKIKDKLIRLNDKQKEALAAMFREKYWMYQSKQRTPYKPLFNKYNEKHDVIEKDDYLEEELINAYHDKWKNYYKKQLKPFEL